MGDMSKWIALDPEKLPRAKDIGPFLVTNNIAARNAHGHPSHVWLCDTMIHHHPEIACGFYIFDDSDRRVQGLTHFMPVFAPVPAGPQRRTPETLRAWAEWFDNPNASPSMEVRIGENHVTPGYLLRRVADALEFLVDTETEREGS